MKPFGSHRASNTLKSEEESERSQGTSMGLAGMDPKVGKRSCWEVYCGRAAITTLDHQSLCLNHFLMRCYETLDSLDPRGRKFRSEPIDVVSVRAFIEECSRKALDVSLQSQTLTNLQRGRLLDIYSGPVNCSCCCESH